MRPARRSRARGFLRTVGGDLTSASVGEQPHVCLTVNARQPVSPNAARLRSEEVVLEPRGEQMSPGSGWIPNPRLGRASGAPWRQDPRRRRSILRGPLCRAERPHPHFLELLEKAELPNVAGRKSESRLRSLCTGESSRWDAFLPGCQDAQPVG